MADLSRSTFVLLSIFALTALTAGADAAVIPLADSGWAIVVSGESLGDNGVSAPFVHEVGVDSVIIDIDKVFNTAPAGGLFTPEAGFDSLSVPGGDVFLPGYSSGQITIVTNPNLEVGTRFGFKEVPTMAPELATLEPLGFGAIIIVCRKRKNYKVKR